MTFNDELQNMFNGAQTVVSELSALAEKPGVLEGNDQLVALSLVEMIGATFIKLGTELEAGNDDGIHKAFAEAKSLYDEALSVIAVHTSRSDKPS